MGCFVKVASFPELFIYVSEFFVLFIRFLPDTYVHKLQNTNQDHSLILLRNTAHSYLNHGPGVNTSPPQQSSLLAYYNK